jgi:hypothetical protein
VGAGCRFWLQGVLHEQGHIVAFSRFLRTGVPRKLMWSWPPRLPWPPGTRTEWYPDCRRWSTFTGRHPVRMRLLA